jgi:hypothetical protein
MLDDYHLLPEKAEDIKASVGKEISIDIPEAESL